ncbi:uncharacterized protein LOC131662123 [Vicia villosa]|uniref:uncharacterized protein LOC131662123 n=1 Tax=Vicia villosa TaxID=3911 RepID=UPI00273A8145|nr:uncharacterized protein LOC131662123 [Vicia villosa]
MDRQTKSHVKKVIGSPRKTVGKDNKSPRKTAVPRQAATAIPDNSVGLSRYIIPEKPRDQSKTIVVELNATIKSVNNLLGENMEQNPRNEGEKNENNKTEAIKTGNRVMEKDDMSWPELFAWELKNANGGELMKEEDVAMISTNKDLLKECIDFKK